MTCEYYDPASLAMELHAMTMYPVDNFKMLRAGLLHLVAEYQLFWSLWATISIHFSDRLSRDSVALSVRCGAQLLRLPVLRPTRGRLHVA